MIITLVISLILKQHYFAVMLNIDTTVISLFCLCYNSNCYCLTQDEHYQKAPLEKNVRVTYNIPKDTGLPLIILIYMY